MTQQEHVLIIGMLAQQMQISFMLLEMLKRGNVISGDDVPAFASAVAPDLVVELVGKQYQQAARELGLTLNLESPPAS